MLMKIVVVRCQILRLKCAKFVFDWGSATDPAVGAHSTPPVPLAEFMVPTKNIYSKVCLSGVTTQHISQTGSGNSFHPS